MVFNTTNTTAGSTEMKELFLTEPFRSIIGACAALVSGFLLVLAFPPYDQAWLGWVAMVPLLLGLTVLRPWMAFFATGWGGIVFCIGFFRWIFEIPGYTMLHHILLGVYLGPLFGFIGFIASIMMRRWSITAAMVAVPFVWVSLEYLRSNLSFLSLPIGLLGHSQYKNVAMIQIASISGVYGVSFLVVLTNAAIAVILLNLKEGLNNTPDSPSRPLATRGTYMMAGVGVVLIILTLVYGHMVANRPINGLKNKIAVVQANILPAEERTTRRARYIIETYRHLTGVISKEKPALIVWPEPATPWYIDRDAGLSKKIRQIARTSDSALLFGNAGYQKLKAGKRLKNKTRNSAYLIPRQAGGVTQRYDKIRLFPFGEYLPMKETLPWSSIGVHETAKFESGNEFTVFQIPGLRFGVTICWENLFPDVARQFVTRGAQLLVNITNEARFGKSVGVYHFISSGVFRAVENRVYVVRCANTGVSCFIDPYGRIINRVRDENGQDIFVRGTLSEIVVAMESKTFYTRHGDRFAQLCTIVSVFLIGIAFLRKAGK